MPHTAGGNLEKSVASKIQPVEPEVPSAVMDQNPRWQKELFVYVS